MTDKIYDLVTIGGGPSGLICAITGITGIPINPSPTFTGLIIEQFQIGEFARYGKLRVTHKWFFMGHRIMDFLDVEARASGMEIREKEKVLEVKLDDEIKIIKTDKNIYKSRKVALCTGFFPHGNLSKFIKHIRVMFSPIEFEVNFIPQEKNCKIGILGMGNETIELARKLKELRPDAECLVIVEKPLDNQKDPEDLQIISGTIKVNNESEENLDITIFDIKGEEIEKKTLNCMLVDYNSYTTDTFSTGFLNNSGLIMNNGYIKADRDGNTGIFGVVAAGNIVTPVSGVITALSTGFTAGLNVYNQLYREKFDKPPLFFPWLPMGDPYNHPLNY